MRIPKWQLGIGLVCILLTMTIIQVSAVVIAQTATPLPVPVSVKAFELPFLLWTAWFGSIGVGLAGLTLIWKFVQKASGLISDMQEYGPVLREIAKEFKSDSGSTLKDSIDRLESATHEAKATALMAQAMAENLQKLVINKNDITA